MAVNDLQKRGFLDQLTDAAMQPPPGIPAPLAPAVPGDESAPPLSLAAAPATTPGSTANLESAASSPDTLAAGIAATKQSAENEKAANPSFLRKLGRLAGGAVGLEDPTSSPQASLGSKIGGLIGRIGAAGALAAGTPEQKEIAEQQLQVPLKMAQVTNEMQYRQGILGEKAKADAIKQQLADQQQQKAQGQMRLKLMLPDENNPGSYRSMTEDEILSDPIASQNRDLTMAAIGSKNAAAALASARRDALLNPNNPTLELKRQQIENTYKLAQAQLGMRVHQQQRQDFQDLQNYGLNVTGQTLNADNAGPFMATDNRGNPVPNKQASPFRPTTGARTKAEQASAIVDSGEQLVSDIKAHADMIGPLASRYNNLANFIGNPPPEFKGLAAELESWIALHPAAHGFRGMNAVQEFQKAFGPIAMTPEALIAGIRGSYNTMGALQRAAQPRTNGPQNSATPPPKQSFANWKATQAQGVK